MKEVIKRKYTGTILFALVILALSLTGCGGGGETLSTEVVSGVAAVGLPLSGEVRLKDSSSTPREKTAIIDKDGSFAFDVTGMTPPFILQARGSAEGTEYKLHSFAERFGIANVNPLSDVIVACAAEVDDPAKAYDDDDSERRKRIKPNLEKTVNTILLKLQPLLARYGAEHKNPITSKFVANHLDLDEMFDNVRIKVKEGILSIINDKTDAVIYSGKVSDIASGNFYPENVPPAPNAPLAPTGVSAVGGIGQVSLAWSPVSNANSYNLYYATSSGVTSATGTKVSAATNSHLQTGLSAGTTYYFVVTAVNSAGESAASAQVQTTTNAAPPVPTAPAAPTGVSAAGGTKQATISWPAVTGATSYNIYWSNSSGVTTAAGTKLVNATSPAVQAGLTDSTTYYYIVTAVNGTGESAPSIQVAATTLAAVPVPTLPAPVTGLAATGGANQVSLSWTPVSGATSYNVYWSNATGVTKANGTKIAGASTPYVHTGLSAGATYYYVVTAVNSAGEGAASAQASAGTAAAVVLDGLALYNQYCSGCHGTAKMGKTALATQSAITANIGGMGSLSALSAAQLAAIATTTQPVVTPPPAPACGTCHAIPPAIGEHAFHSNRASCTTCHGTGYSATTVNAATHLNGVKNLTSTIGWNATTRSCSNSCHGNKSW